MSATLPPTATIRPRDLPSALRSLSRSDWSSLRAAWWAQRAARSVRRQLQLGGLEQVRVRPAPVGPPPSARGVAAVLRRRQERCLVRSVVWQAWHAAQGSDRDLVIGVTSPADGFEAHAWLDGDEVGGTGFVEISRHPVRA